MAPPASTPDDERLTSGRTTGLGDPVEDIVGERDVDSGGQIKQLDDLASIAKSPSRCTTAPNPNLPLANSAR